PAGDMPRSYHAHVRHPPTGEAEDPSAGRIDQWLHLLWRRAQIGDFERIERAAGSECEMRAVGEPIEPRLRHWQRADLASIALVGQGDGGLLAGWHGDLDGDWLCRKAAA